MTDQTPPEEPESVQDKIKRLKARAEKEVHTLGLTMGIFNAEGKLEGLLPRAVALKFLHHVVTGFYGLNERITTSLREVLRTAGVANQVNNIANIHLKIFCELGVKKGWWKDQDEFSVMFNDAAKEMAAEAKAEAEAGGMERTQKVVGDTIKANKQEVGDRLHSPEEDKTADGQEEG